jgi:hypothetical protein
MGIWWRIYAIIMGFTTKSCWHMMGILWNNILSSKLTSL